ncbi:unnamed protein product [Lampetra planeri]
MSGAAVRGAKLRPWTGATGSEAIAATWKASADWGLLDASMRDGARFTECAAPSARSVLRRVYCATGPSTLAAVAALIDSPLIQYQPVLPASVDEPPQLGILSYLALGLAASWASGGRVRPALPAPRYSRQGNRRRLQPNLLSRAHEGHQGTLLVDAGARAGRVSEGRVSEGHATAVRRPWRWMHRHVSAAWPEFVLRAPRGRSSSRSLESRGPHGGT